MKFVPFFAIVVACCVCLSFGDAPNNNVIVEFKSDFKPSSPDDRELNVMMGDFHDWQMDEVSSPVSDEEAFLLKIINDKNAKFDDIEKHLLLEAEQDNLIALRFLACIYLDGKLTRIDRNKALEYLTWAVKGGDVISAEMIAELMMDDSFSTYTPHVALKLIADAESEGNIRASLLRAICLHEGLGVEKNVNEATAVFNQLAQKGSRHAEAYSHILEIKNRDKVEWTKEDKQLMKQRCTSPEVEFIYAINLPSGALQNSMLDALSAKGHVPSFGEMRFGDDGNVDMKKYLPLLGKAVDKGDPYAAHGLVMWYPFFSEEIGKDEEEMTVLAKYAYDQRCFSAESAVIMMETQNEEKMANMSDEIKRERMEFMRQAAEARGDALTMNNYGTLLLMGTYAPQDVINAEKWLLKASDKGRAMASRTLGALYGGAVNLDPEQAKLFHGDVERARLFLKRAIEQGDSSAVKELEYFESMQQKE